jgi:hypothetical protein
VARPGASVWPTDRPRWPPSPPGRWLGTAPKRRLPCSLGHLLPTMPCGRWLAWVDARRLCGHDLRARDHWTGGPNEYCPDAWLAITGNMTIEGRGDTLAISGTAMRFAGQCPAPSGAARWQRGWLAHQTPRGTPLFREGESSHGPTDSIRDCAGREFREAASETVRVADHHPGSSGPQRGVKGSDAEGRTLKSTGPAFARQKNC